MKQNESEKVGYNDGCFAYQRRLELKAHDFKLFSSKIMMNVYHHLKISIGGKTIIITERFVLTILEKYWGLPF